MRRIYMVGAAALACGLIVSIAILISIRQSEPLGPSPLQKSATLGRSDQVRALLERGDSPNEYPDVLWYRASALHFAKTPEVALLLLQYGAKIDALDEFKNTPLHTAASKGNFAVTQLLLEKGANPNARGNGGQTPLHSAVGRYTPEQSKEAENAILKTTTVLLKYGADINAATKEGETALAGAVILRHADAVRLLLAQGARVDVRWADGRTLLNEAEIYSDHEIVALLKAHESKGK